MPVFTKLTGIVLHDYNKGKVQAGSPVSRKAGL